VGQDAILSHNVKKTFCGQAVSGAAKGLDLSACRGLADGPDCFFRSNRRDDSVRSALNATDDLLPF
jgi:hypothetical protein